MIEQGGASPDRTVTVHNGVDPSKFDRAVTGASIRDLHQIWDGPVLVVIGRLTPQKGHIYLLQALPSLVNEWPQLRCLIVGEGEMRGRLDALAQSLGLGRHCVFAGVSDAIPEVLAAADLFVLPSLSEGFPFVVLEALAMGCPVVATAIDGVTEVIQDGVTGRLVPPRDPTALAGAIREMLRDPAGARTMGMRGRRLVEERFTADRMMAQMMAMIEGLCGRQDATLPAQARARR
jgi:glycosyltransferase involved in cell wall biosynthesis